jgi:hypothetical protein
MVSRCLKRFLPRVPLEKSEFKQEDRATNP